MTHDRKCFWWLCAVSIVLGTLSASVAMAQVGLKAHNEERALVGVPPLEWSDEMAQLAQEWAQEIANGKPSGCPRAPSCHRDQSDFANICDFNYCGENIWSGKGTTIDQAQAELAPKTTWIDYEKGWFDAVQGKCKKNADNGSGSVCTSDTCCGHYTQVVSIHSTHVGCGLANGSWGAAFVCNYKQGGNFFTIDGHSKAHPLKKAGGSGGSAPSAPAFKVGDYVAIDFRSQGLECVKITKSDPDGQLGWSHASSGYRGTAPASYYKTLAEAGLDQSSCSRAAGQADAQQAGGAQQSGGSATFSGQELLQALNDEYGLSLQWDDALAQGATDWSKGQTQLNVAFNVTCNGNTYGTAAETAKQAPQCNQAGTKAGIWIGSSAAAQGFLMLISQ